MNILLHGPPGCGKSSFIEITAHELKRNIRFMQITPKITDEQFSTAISALGESDILVCEDIDCLFVDRKNSDTDKNAMTFSGLLNCFDGINGGKNGLIVFLTTNHKCTLDKALTRPGRVDITVEFSYMNNNTIKNMVKWYFESNYDEEDFNKFYLKIKDYKLTGAIMAQFLLSMVLDEKYALLDNYKLLHSIVKENNYEEDVIKENMYT
jgi:ATP-dependent 26S proteasome regulatory subunit